MRSKQYELRVLRTAVIVFLDEFMLGFYSFFRR